MNTHAVEQIFNWLSGVHALQEPFVLGAAATTLLLIGVAFLLNGTLRRVGVLDAGLHREIQVRTRTWCWLAACILLPILLGPGWVTGAVLCLSLLCLREFARATGIFRERGIGLIAVLGTVGLAFANAIHYERMYFALASLTVGALVIVTLPNDAPKGYLQRTALGVLAFLLFGYSLGYLGLFTGNRFYRSILLLIFVAVEMNDVFAFCLGKTIGRQKLLPQTSPGKTKAGAVGAFVLTTGLVMLVGHFIFAATRVDRWDYLLELGALVAGLGQTGDLVLSSVKRDLGLKDLGAALPGHGGWLDRFDSLVLVPPAVYHFLSFHLGPLGAHSAAGL